jgi:AraC-like DNA-binding protein
MLEQHQMIFQEAVIYGTDGFPVKTGVARSNDPYDHFRHHHADLEFHLIRHGVSTYNICGVEYPCERNSLLIMHENEPHYYVTSAECHDKVMGLMFTRGIVEHRVIARTALHRLGPLHHLILTERQAGLVEFLWTEIGMENKFKGVHWRQVILDHLENFLALLHRVAEQNAFIPEIHDPLVQDVVKYLEGRYTGKCSLSEVAGHFSVCTFTLSKKFNHHMGLGFREYILQRRVLAAQTLLEQTNLKIASIAGRVGFDTLTAFNRYFRIVTGMTPAVYRRLAHMEEPARA